MLFPTTNIKLYNVLRLADDGLNWVTYKAQILTAFGVKGLKQHIEGCVQEPCQTEICKDSKIHIVNQNEVILDNKVVELDDEQDCYDQSKDQVRQQIYKTISN
ncbi:hypothetical protein BDN71DRAFT_1392438 [Pleurotus eryngii]|uniref:Uncharacterized protein n=1 Tax=Pleurotus eryngii TaxID=5323 RepID=A0A9P5ZWH7_PLEER|nr:hypothetical protein BDN71DRAFT_1392438 [Pleurotus eryngii]